MNYCDHLLDYEKEHLEKMRAFAPECMVLLKKNGDFPLDGPCRIAVYGSGARNTVKGGTGSGDVNVRFSISVEQGLEDAGFTVTSKEWLDGYDQVRAKAHTEFIADIKQRAKQQHTMPVLLGMGMVMPEPDYQLPLTGEGDTALYVLARNSGEGNDRKPEAGDIHLSETEIRDILTANRKYKRFMLVLNTGGMVDISPVSEVDNILILSQLGSVTGWAMADVLLGVSNPSGKLTATWCAWQDMPAIGEFGEPDDTRYREGIYVGYRYFDSVRSSVAYPFGFGLSYTEFSLGKADVRLNGTKLTLTLPVTNCGNRCGKETVQVYVSAPWGDLDQPYQTLAGFAKTSELAPGAEETVSVSFDMEELASYDEKSAAYILEAGKYVIRAGQSSRSTVPAAIVFCAEKIIVHKVSNIGGRPDFTDWKPEPPEAEHLPAGLPALKLDPAAFEALIWPQSSSVSTKAKELVKNLADEQIARLCVGNFQDSAGVASVIGMASQAVAGAAGDTCSRIPGIPSLVMADGPAGLRLAQEYTRDAAGAHAVGSTMPAGLDEFFGPVEKFVMGLFQKKPKGEIHHQFCTALPVGTALAQSWNSDLCEACGDIVGDEMERFGIHLWLAPAFNIQRSPLCGRNFEYYSEDPLLSGKIGAAVTKGVQKHAGRGATVKHLCCNNQETNRYISSSMVSERALREIYLRGFKICVAEADPCAIMTSYNLLNGVHTSERTDLLKTVVRGEWGYRGLIMTDWVVSMMSSKGKYRMAKPAPTIWAGNDIFMPGGPADYKALLKALKGKDTNCSIHREDLAECAAHVVDLALRLSDSIEINQ